VPQFPPAILVLADGTVFRGHGIGAVGSSVGEVVFNTSMVGYQEILTDPSYTRQIVTLTYPHIGNYGINPEDGEAGKVYAAGLVIRDLPLLASNFRSAQTLDAYLKAQNVVAIADIDTRKLTRILREKGAQAGCLVTGDNPDVDAALAAARGFPGLAGMDLAKVVTTDKAYPWTEGEWVLGKGYVTQENPKYHVVAYDFGVKRNILRMLADLGCKLTVVPAHKRRPATCWPSTRMASFCPTARAIRSPATTPLPPSASFSTRRTCRCSASASATSCWAGRGRQDAEDEVRSSRRQPPGQGSRRSGTVLITSQNHGFAVDRGQLPATLRVTHVSLFDGSLQGMPIATTSPALQLPGAPRGQPRPA
jgi:carbamoyl-phosphate synthase small subunit